MMRKVFCVLIACLTGSLVNAGEGDYAVSKIAPALLKDANAVIRVDQTRFEIISLTRAVQKTRWVVTVLNENGERYAYFYEYYDKLRKVNSVEGTLYDASGKALKKMKTKDAEDVSGVDESSLIDDNRVKRHSFFYRTYPYTVEYETEVEINNTFAFPNWVGIPGEKVSVEQSSMVLVCPIDYEFRFKAFNYPGEPVREQKEKTKSASWSVSNLPAITREPYSPMWHELTPYIVFGPTSFQVDDYKGNMSSWLEFGKFVHALKQGRDQLPDAIKQKVHELTDKLPDIPSKIRALYNYMQKNTRYISIQLGIGGWQPFDARFVATKSYGDCKALTNYMYSMLKEIGINSFYTLVRAGTGAGYITHDFPAQQFNHVILCVPLQKDTTWLECTSSTSPAGYLGGFTSDRYALMVSEQGGQLVKTASYSVNENLQLRTIKADLKEDATLAIKASTHYHGIQQDNIHGLINSVSKDKVKEVLQEQLDFATYDIASFEYKEEKSTLPSIHETLDISVSNYATITGKRLFIVPNVMSRTYRKPEPVENRKYDIVLGTGYKDIDSVTIEIPAGYTAESIPQDVSLSSSFGKFSCSVKFNGKQLTYYRSMEYFGGRHPAKNYPDMVKFFESIYKADRNKVVLVRSEQPVKGF